MFFLELAGNFFTVLCVFLAARNHVLTWPVGIIGSLLYGIMFYESKLYADVALQGFFILTSLKGWINWQHKKQVADLPITRTGKKHLFLFYVPAGILAAIFYGYMLFKLTDASFPFLDSVILTFSVIGQLLLMKRRLETWLFWIIVDLIAVPLYGLKGLYMTSGVYFLFLLNAVYGFWQWRHIFRRQAEGPRA